MTDLTDIITAHSPFEFSIDFDPVGECGCGARVFYEEWAEHLAEALRKSRTITTADQLDALPLESVIRDSAGRVWQREDFDGTSSVYDWTRFGDENVLINLRDLPALLLWQPKDEETDR